MLKETIYNSIYKGMILDGLINVGKFDDISNYSSGGIRSVKNLRLKPEYVNIVKEQSTKDLQFLFVANLSGDKTILIEDIGIGQVFGKFMIGEPFVIFSEALFVPIPKKGTYEN